MHRHRDEVATAARLTSADPRYTAAGKTEAIQAALVPIRQRNAAAVAQIRAQVDAADQTIGDAIDRATPQPVPGFEGEFGRSRRWARLEPLLDKGMNPGTVIREADHPEDLFALDEELPAWLQARVGANRAGVDAGVQRLRTRIRFRLIDMVQEPERTQGLAAITGLPDLEYIYPLLINAEQEVTGQVDVGAALHAAVEADRARKQAQADLDQLPWDFDLDGNADVRRDHPDRP
jgi:hypothetical protein